MHKVKSGYTASTIVKSLCREKNLPASVPAISFEISVGAYLHQAKSPMQVTCLIYSLQETALVLVERLCSTSHKTSSSTHTVLTKQAMSTAGIEGPAFAKLSVHSLESLPIFYFSVGTLHNLCIALPFPFIALYIRWISAKSAFMKHCMLYEITVANDNFSHCQLVLTGLHNTLYHFHMGFPEAHCTMNPFIFIPSNPL